MRNIPDGNPRVTEYIGRGMLTILYSEIRFIVLYSFAPLSVAEVEKWEDKKLGWLWFVFMRNREWSQ